MKSFQGAKLFRYGKRSVIGQHHPPASTRMEEVSAATCVARSRTERGTRVRLLIVNTNVAPFPVDVTKENRCFDSDSKAEEELANAPASFILFVDSSVAIPLGCQP